MQASFRTRREALGFSLREMAKKLKVSAPYLSDLELGVRGEDPKNPTIERLESTLAKLEAKQEEAGANG